MSQELTWMRRARRLHALGVTGEFYSTDAFSIERYQEITKIALEMLADVGGVPVDQVAELFAEGPGYRTPKIEVRGAVIKDNRILLVQEKSDRCWALPGGFADVGLSGSENVAKEIHEEANLEVVVTRLYAVRHKSKYEYTTDLRDFYKLYYLCEQINTGQPEAGLETAAAKFFRPNDLPTLSMGRTIPSDIELAFAAAADVSTATIFD